MIHGRQVSPITSFPTEMNSPKTLLRSLAKTAISRSIVLCLLLIIVLSLRTHATEAQEETLPLPLDYVFDSAQEIYFPRISNSGDWVVFLMKSPEGKILQGTAERIGGSWTTTFTTIDADLTVPPSVNGEATLFTYGHSSGFLACRQWLGGTWHELRMPRIGISGRFMCSNDGEYLFVITNADHRMTIYRRFGTTLTELPAPIKARCLDGAISNDGSVFALICENDEKSGESLIVCENLAGTWDERILLSTSGSDLRLHDVFLASSGDSVLTTAMKTNGQVIILLSRRQALQRWSIPVTFELSVPPIDGESSMTSDGIRRIVYTGLVGLQKVFIMTPGADPSTIPLSDDASLDHSPSLSHRAADIVYVSRRDGLNRIIHVSLQEDEQEKDEHSHFLRNRMLSSLFFRALKLAILAL